MSNSVEIAPNLSVFLSSFREIGYQLDTAVADIVDNSISANASNVRISVVPSEMKAIIFDDGDGMDKNTLIEAMRLGTKRDLRQIGDLGKFGLGLKTASFSQTKTFSVLSKQKGGEIYGLRWDIPILERENRWLADEVSYDDIKDIIVRIDPDIVNRIQKSDSWTIVIWENMDRYETEHLETLMGDLREHLSLVFHKFLSKEGFRGHKISLFFNGTELIAKNPFAEALLATQKNPTETVTVKGHDIRITAYDLPNYTKLTKKQYDDLDGGDGFTKNQGFYLYREGRLLVGGTWFRLAKVSDATALARIMIDIDNTQDELWNIDVKKSMAEPIPEVRAILMPYALKVRSRSKTTKSHRGVKRDVTNWWVEEDKPDGKVAFKINRKHPLYIEIAESLGVNKNILDSMLNKIEQTVPVRAIDAVINQDPYSIYLEKDFSEESVKELALFLKEQGKDRNKVFEIIKIDYDDKFDKQINEILDEVFA